LEGLGGLFALAGAAEEGKAKEEGGTTEGFSSPFSTVVEPV
jgi:hypothetical protein